jgi:putative FmdB family regulatory protein
VPTYQYVCTECDTPLEAVQSFTDDALTVCPTCGGRLRKVFSAVGVVFKGSGFYRTDSRSTSSASVGDSSDSGKSAAKESSSGSSDKGTSSEKSGSGEKASAPKKDGSSSSSGSGGSTSPAPKSGDSSSAA